MEVLISTKSKSLNNRQGGAFRPLYYLGCKTGFASAIKSAIDEVDPSGGRLLDIFAGTGSIGAELGKTREVTTVDIQEYSRVICSAVLCPPIISKGETLAIVASLFNAENTRELLWCLQPLIDYESECIDQAITGEMSALVELLESPPLVIRAQIPTYATSRFDDISSEAIRRLNMMGLWQAAESTVSRYFGGLYFSFSQAAMLDSILTLAESFGEQNRDIFKAAALSTASQIVNTVGKQFAQPIQPRNKFGLVKPNLIKVVQRDRSFNVLDLFQSWLEKYLELPKKIGKPQALRENYLSAIENSASTYSVVYADPPYTRDHYSRFYHVLETMCLRDNPTISQMTKDGSRTHTRGAYREDRHQSDFCIRSTAPSAFDALFRAVRERNLPLILSYSPHEADDGTHPRVVSMSNILDIANQYYSHVEVFAIDGITHNKLNRNGLNLKTREQAEIILKCFK